MRSREQDEGVARVHFGSDRVDGLCEIGARRLGIERQRDAHLVVEAGAGLLHGGAKGLGILHGEVEWRKEGASFCSWRRPPLILVGVDADGQDVQLRLDPIGGPRERNLRARWQRGQQVRAVVSDRLDGIVAGIERHLPAHGIDRTAARGLGGNCRRDAVDAPLDAPDPFAAIRDASGHGHEIFVRAATECVRGDFDERSWSAVDDFVEVYDLCGSLHLPIGILSKCFAHEIGIEQRLMNLINEGQLVCSRNTEQTTGPARAGKETIAGDGKPFTVNAGQLACQQLAGGKAPGFGSPVPSPRHRAQAIGRERDGVELAQMPAERSQKSASRRIPKLHCLVAAGGKHARTVRRECNRFDAARMPPLKGMQKVAAGGVPKPDGAILTA